MPANAGATIYGIIDDRTTAPSYELASVGTLTGGKGGSYGSAFLVDECVVLSARHVGSLRGTALGRRLKFQAAGLSSRGQVVAAGEWNAKHPIDYETDWMAVRLDRCLGREIGYLSVSSLASVYAATKDMIFKSAGFPGDRSIAAGLTVDPRCQPLWTWGREFGHDCASVPGNSGGPVLAFNGKGWAAVGIAVGGNNDRQLRYSAQSANVAVNIGEVLPEICSHLSPNDTKHMCSTLHKSDHLIVSSNVGIGDRAIAEPFSH